MTPFSSNPAWNPLSPRAVGGSSRVPCPGGVRFDPSAVRRLQARLLRLVTFVAGH